MANLSPILDAHRARMKGGPVRRELPRPVSAGHRCGRGPITR